jgi:hypothetical protein
VTELATLLGTVALFVSVGLLAWQSREIAKQTRINNAIAATTCLVETFNQLHKVIGHFVEDPNLRDYFYSGKMPPKGKLEYVKIATLAEMFADVLDCGLKSNSLLPSTAAYDDWRSYAEFLASRSPIMVEVIQKQDPSWWPVLVDIFVKPELTDSRIGEAKKS